ncbi:MAG: flagellar biosynthesis anti-sigma factor FlgM [Burkholderiaceae bacterium]|nr:flagellar biosynthesis anti-sigma factor FlgM [Burkholderiaceae bacterium]
MKIGNNIESLQPELVNRATNASRSPAASGKEVAAVEATDRVELSGTSRSLATSAGGSPDAVRAEKVAEVREAIQQGKFHVSAQAVADKMINEAAELIEAITSGRGR